MPAETAVSADMLERMLETGVPRGKSYKLSASDTGRGVL